MTRSSRGKVFCAGLAQALRHGANSERLAYRRALRAGMTKSEQLGDLGEAIGLRGIIRGTGWVAAAANLDRA